MQVYVYTLSFGSLCAHRSVNPRGNASAYTLAKPETVATPDPAVRPTTVLHSPAATRHSPPAPLTSLLLTHAPCRGPEIGDSSAISTGLAVLLSAVTTPVRASVQTGDDPRGVTPANLAREAIWSALRPRLGASPVRTTVSRPWSQSQNHGLTTVVTGHGVCYPVEISENSLFSLSFVATAIVQRSSEYCLISWCS